jgi:hypothetical protein
MKTEKIEQELLELLRNNSVDAVIIKGSSLAKRIYSEYRVSSDIDILIREEDIFPVDKLLCNRGYIPDPIPLRYYIYRFSHTIYYHPETKIPIEIHWNFGIPYFFKLSSQQIWSKVSIDDDGLLWLSPEVQLVMLLIHHHTHCFRELRILLDILWSLHKFRDIIDWHAFASRLREYGLLKTTLITLCQISELWKSQTEELRPLLILKEEIPKYRKTSGLLLKYFMITPANNFKNNIYRDKIMSRLALDGHMRAFSSFFKTLFPPPKVIKALYNIKNSLLIPFYYPVFISWRLKDWIRFF